MPATSPVSAAPGRHPDPAASAKQEDARRRNAGTPDTAIADVPLIASDLSRLLPSSPSSPTLPNSTPPTSIPPAGAGPETGGFSFEFPSFDLPDFSLGDISFFDF